MRLVLPARIDPAALAGHDPGAAVVALDGETMGTTWRLRYAAPPGDDDRAVRVAIEARLADLVDQLSHWAPGSALCRYNRAPAGSWVTLPDDFAQVVDAGVAMAARTGGAFDPFAGRLVDLWGFGPPGPAPVPDATLIATALAHSGYRRAAWDRDARRLRQPGGLALDLSGIAKGHAADAVADLLAGRGLRHCLVEIGGELVGRGLRPDGDPWWVDLEDPPGATLPPLRVALHRLAVATSGSYRRGSHNLDPRTGSPPQNGVVSVGVVAATAMQADALATAITILFPDLSTLRDLAPAARIVERTDEGFRESVTPALAAMMAA